MTSVSCYTYYKTHASPLTFKVTLPNGWTTASCSISYETCLIIANFFKIHAHWTTVPFNLLWDMPRRWLLKTHAEWTAVNKWNMFLIHCTADIKSLNGAWVSPRWRFLLLLHDDGFKKAYHDHPKGHIAISFVISSIYKLQGLPVKGGHNSAAWRMLYENKLFFSFSWHEVSTEGPQVIQLGQQTSTGKRRKPKWQEVATIIPVLSQRGPAPTALSC